MCCNELVQILNATDAQACFNVSNVAKENGKEFRINTQKNLCRVKNDGCLNSSKEEKKCDYIFKVCETKQVFLVELKGTNIDDAIAQIVASFKKLQLQLNNTGHSFKAFIVSSSVPSAAEQKFRQLKAKHKRDLNLDIDKRHSKYEINI